jgi:hypothetical protein
MKPLGIEEMRIYSPPGTRVISYSQLLRIKNLDSQLDRGPLIILLKYMPNYGHWISISKSAPNEYNYFSSYGTKPENDSQFIGKYFYQYNAPKYLLKNYLKNKFNQNYKIFFNEIKYQNFFDNTKSCGVWVLFFLNSGKNINEFNNFIKKHFKKKNYESIAEQYYRYLRRGQRYYF